MVFTKSPIKGRVQVGQRYGHVTISGTPAKKPVGKQGRFFDVVKAVCDCGKECEVPLTSLKSEILSCGCVGRAIGDKARTKHGMSDDRLYGIWKGMLRRCENTADTRFAYYGGRGINVCLEWHDLKKFSDWAKANGYADELSIDRIDNNKGYSPNNCRWASGHTQARNRRTVVDITAFGETKCITDWISDPRCPLTSCAGLRQRLDQGMSPEDAITMPHFDGVTAFGETKNFRAWARDPRAKVVSETIRTRVLKGMNPEEAITKPPCRLR